MTKDLLNSCKLNLFRDAKIPGEDLTGGKLTNSQDEIFNKENNQPELYDFLALHQKLSTVFRLVYFFHPFVLRLKNADL